MNKMQNSQIQNLLALAQQNPNDDKLLSQIAFAYLTTPYIKSDELTYFKKAYEVNPSIKNTHNYAFWAYYEYGEDELALKLFEELMTKNPSSFYPYMAYAHFLFTPLDYSDNANIDAVQHNLDLEIELYQKAITLFYNSPQNYQNNHLYELAYVYNNLANIYAINQNFIEADKYYNQAIHLFSTIVNDNQTDLDCETLKECLYFTALNKVRLKILANDMMTAKIFLELAKHNECASNADIAHIYALMGDYQACYHEIQYEDIHLSFDWVCYAIFKINPIEYKNKVAKEIKEIQICLNEYRANLADCQEPPEQEDLKSWITDCETELADLKNKQNTPPTPKLSAKEQCLVDLHYFYKCWLFGCERCGNLADDD